MTEKLIMVTKTTHYVDGSHLERYLSAKTGLNCQVIESSNDTDYSVTVKKEKIPSYDQEALDEFLQNGYISMDYGYDTIFTHAANMDWIEEGNYVIRVSW